MRLRVPAVALCATTVLAIAAMAPGRAQAATAISGCFGVNGTMVTGLSTDVQYLTTVRTWHSLAGSVGQTDASGCVHYRISGAARRYSLRIHAAGVVPAWAAMVDGATPHYAPGRRRSYALGTSNMRVSYLPPSVATTPQADVDTSDWLNQMTDGSACANDPSPAMQVACYMDRHNMHGNVVVLDDDHDGVENAQDRYPQDSRYW